MARTLNTPVFFTVQVLLCQIASSGANSFSADNFGTVSYQQGINGDSTERGRLPLVYSFPEPTFYPGVTSGTLPINAHNDLVGFSGLGDIVMARTLNTPVFFTVQVLLCQIASNGANSFSADNFGTVSYQQGINGDSTERGRLPLVYSFPEPTFYPGVTSGTLPINAHNDLVGFSGLGDIVMARTLNTPVFFTVQTQARAKHSLWWPGISRDVEESVKRCQRCIEKSSNRKMPLLPTGFSERPWQRLSLDLFYHHNKWWLIVTDYFSRYPEVAQLSSLTSETVIRHCKSIFARHGIPEVVVSENGPQFSRVKTSAFSRFAQEYGFQHIPSSPHYPQSNDLAEGAVKIIKKSMEKTGDP
ncbi:uncharacterized protein ISCGN_024020 [Ixodes scapularis]